MSYLCLTLQEQRAKREAKVVVARIIGGGDNNSYMYESGSLTYAGRAITPRGRRQEVSPKFRLARERYDDSCVKPHRAQKQHGNKTTAIATKRQKG